MNVMLTDCPPVLIEAAETAPAWQAAIERAIPLIKRFEGLRLRAYRDPRPGDPLLTVGYGHTGREVRDGLRITREQAEMWVRRDAATAACVVAESVHVPLSANQKAALISFAFNVGGPKFTASAVVKALNRGDYAGAVRALLRYCHAGKPPKPLPGLLARRQSEARLFTKTEEIAHDPTTR